MCPTDLRRKSDLELFGTLPGDVEPEPLGENPEHILMLAVIRSKECTLIQSKSPNVFSGIVG